MSDDSRTTLLTARQVAGEMGVCRETVKRWARTGRVPAVKNVSGHWLFHREDIAELPVAEHG